MKKNKIINIAVIAHVDAGKSTLVDAFLSQSGIFRDNEQVVDCVMDSNALERERGITIYSKNCAIEYQGYKINIVDTPGHSDFSSEVERILKTVDTVILLVDSSEGPMPQTRFVLQKSLSYGLKPILFINKIDKKDQRAEEVVDMTFDLFVELNATDEQLDFPILFGIAREGIARKEMTDKDMDLKPLFDTILNHVEAYPDLDSKPLQMQISNLAYDDYIGRLGIGRVHKGTIKQGQVVSVSKRDGSIVSGKIAKLFCYEGLHQIPALEASSGDMAVIAGIADISIGETIGLTDQVEPMELIQIEDPTLAMNFLVNDSPFCGQSGKYVTSRHIKDRLDKELEINVGLRVAPLQGLEGYRVSGRGELHLSILLENMRREGFEVAVSKPEVLMKKDAEGHTIEPVEFAVISVPDEFSGTVISKLNLRKGTMESMISESGYTRLTYYVPTRGLLGFRTEFINDTRGEGTLMHSFSRYEKFLGDIPGRLNGVLVSQTNGTAMAYSLFNLGERSMIFIHPGTDLYEGMIIGMNSRATDMTVNPTKNKKLTNTRASGNDDAIRLTPPRKFSLEESLEFIAEDELVEITPDAIRFRKKTLTEIDRIRQSRVKNGPRKSK